MSQLIHTPGPVWIDDDGCIAAGTGDEYVTIADPHCGDLNLPENGRTMVANKRLLAAAYNAFDSAARKLGLNAVEFAERVADGGIADLVDALEALEEGDPRVTVLLRAALAKVRGEAS